MSALALLAALALRASAAIPVVSTEPFSVGGAALSGAEVDDLLSAPGGPYVIVGDRLVKAGPSDGPGQAVPADEGMRMLRARVAGRVEALRAAAREGRATPADRAEARALAAARSSLLALEDRWFLRSLSPELDDEEFIKLPAPVLVPPPGPPAAADPLAVQFRARLILDARGDPLAREALDMAVRRLLESPTARELAADVVKRGLTIRVSFEELENSVVAQRGGHRSIEGYGGLSTHGTDGPWIKLNRDYLRIDTAYLLRDLPSTLGHEVLGHALGAARAAEAGLVNEWNRWRGDEIGAGLVGWLVAAELGYDVEDAHMRRWLDDPEGYFRGMHLAGGYYAKTFSAEEAADPRHAYAERLGRVEAALELLDREAAESLDWNAVIDHFKTAHGVDPRRIALVRMELANAYHPAERAAARARLLDVRRELQAALASLDDPAEAASVAAAAKGLRGPFFVEAEARLSLLGDRLRAAAAAAPKPRPRDPADFDMNQMREMYRRDLVENPSHWPLAR